MKHSERAGFAIAITMSLTHTLSAQASADAYPSRPVRIILGQTTGGATDTRARMFATKLSQATRQQFIVDNRPGSGSVLAFSTVAKAPPDGYTLLAVVPSFTFSPALHRSLPVFPLAPVRRDNTMRELASCP